MIVRAGELLAVLAILIASFFPVARAFTINSVEHRPTYPKDSAQTLGPEGTPDHGPPIDIRQHRLYPTGDDRERDSSVEISRFLHLGCFKADLAITTDVQTGFQYDPNECLDLCKQNFGNHTPTKDIIVAVYARRCACILKDMTTFKEVLPSMCTEYCKYYRNPICGGAPDYWGVFKEYDLQSLSAQGAYDPWRYVWYTVVVVKEISIQGGFSIADGVIPERYYLHAVDMYTGIAQFQYQMALEGVLYGLQYDIDSTRLVGLYTSQTTGRIRDDVDWKYQLCTILINTTFEDKPIMEQTIVPLFITVQESLQYLGYSGATAILSKNGIDVYCFTQVDTASSTREMKDRFYIVQIPTGQILYDYALDFKILQLFSNEKYGDISAVGPREQFLSPGMGGRQQYMYLGRVYRSDQEERTLINWRYNMDNPENLAPIEVIGEYHLYPGVSVSEHLYNKSALIHSYMPPENDLWHRAFTLTEINIRTQLIRHWCNETELPHGDIMVTARCHGTIFPDIPYAGLFNREPGIPLSLKSPSMISARFTLQAGTIIVDFDRSTLQGALPIDDNADYVPDRVDDSTQPVAEFDCGEVFDEATVLLLGPYNPDDLQSTMCTWTTDATVTISLPSVLNITVGDSIYVKSDTIYTIPYDGEWSPAATGGIQVDNPDPLEPPVIVLTGPTQIDECSSVKLVVADSYNVGKWNERIWSLLPGTEDESNPRDLTNDPFRTYDQAKLQTLRDELAYATENNNESLEMPSSLLESASTYKIQLRVGSRWGLQTNKTVSLTKLSFSAPSVLLFGPSIWYKNKTERFSLQAIGTPSTCAGADTVLAFRWSSVPPLDWVSEVTSDVLVVEPGILQTPTNPDEEYREYNFTVSCYVDTAQGNVPAKTAMATKTIRVRRSPVYVVFRTEGLMLTRGDILVLDVRMSQDPDNPTPEGQTFNGTFEWWCLNPGRTACFGSGTTGKLSELITCRTDIGTRIVDGGVTFYAPMFDDKEYCRYARGVVMVKTTNFNTGEYKFKVRATAVDGRSAEGEALVTITNVRVPRINLAIVPEGKAKYPTTQAIRIVGTEEKPTIITRRLQDSSNVTRTYSWNVEKWMLNPAYNLELANEMKNDPDNPYTVDEYTFQDRTKQMGMQDPMKFVTNPTQPNLLIRENVLMPSTKYRFKLNIDVGEAIGYSVILIQTAGLRPRSGRLVCDPRNASSDTMRVLSAPDWVAEDPLVYDFGYYSELATGGNTETIRNKFRTEPVPVSSLELDFIPLGEPTTNFTLIIFVDISTPYGATTTETLAVQSWRPENTTEAVLNGLALAAEANGAKVLGNLQYTLAMDPTNPELQSQVLDIMNDAASDIPATPSQQTLQAVLLNDMINNVKPGENTDKYMDAVEDLTLKAAVTESFQVDPKAPGGNLAAVVVSALGSLMPAADNPQYPGSVGAQGASLSMTGLTSVNHAFTFNTVGQGPMDDDNMQLISQDASRARSNHPLPTGDSNIVNICPNWFCDRVPLTCVPQQHSSTTIYVCCAATNPQTLCNEPPCWFRGVTCPSTASGIASAARRLQNRGRALQYRSRATHTPAQPKGSSAWFDSWSTHNFPLRDLDQDDASDYDRASAFHGWHPDIYERRLQFSEVNRTMGDGERVVALEQSEEDSLEESKRLTAEKEDLDQQTFKAEATQVLSFDSMDGRVGQKMRDQYRESVEAKRLFKMELERNISQRITRIFVLRDTIAKQLITQIMSNEKPLALYSKTFVMQVGKTTNLSNVHSSFIFPKQFQVPSDSPDYPTPSNNVTGFSFVYVDYKSNIYYWSDSNVFTGKNKLITLIVMKASTDDLPERSTPDPIVVFSDVSLYSNTICLWWDRFAPNTAGGSWSTQGVINDGEGCRTSHLSDIGIFIDGRKFSGTKLVDFSARWEREIWRSITIGGGDEINYVVVSVLGMVLFTNMLLIMLGYVVDETKRQDMDGKQKSRYTLDGDGITGPLTVDDPIAYAYVGEKPIRLCYFTVWNMIKREHAVLGPLYYHELFTRPQRLQCFTCLCSGLLAINAAIQSDPGYTQEARTWFITGILSGLLLYPVYCGLLLMFNMRPRAVKKRLIKRSTSTKEIDDFVKQRDVIARQTALMPKGPEYSDIPPAGPLGMLAHPGDTTVLNFPAPLPLPPLPPGMPGGVLGATGHAALPNIPVGMSVTQSSGIAGMGGAMALPALPGMTANMPLPPPPRYPPPPKNANFNTPMTHMPPLDFPKIGPPPQPFPSLPPPDVGGTNKSIFGAFDVSNTFPPVSADTGATPMQLADVTAMPGGPNAFGAIGDSGMDTQASPNPPNMLLDDGRHNMAPPGVPDTPAGGTPAGGTPLGGTPAGTPRDAPVGPPRSFTPPGGGTPMGGTPAAGTPVVLTPKGGTPLGGTPQGGRSPVRGSTPMATTPTGSQDIGAGVGAIVSPSQIAPPSASPPSNFRLPPPPPSQLVAQGDGPMPLFVRAAAPPMLSAPYAPAPTGPTGLSSWKAKGPGPPGMLPPIPSAKVGGGAPQLPMPPLVPPPPPPPPSEAEEAFIRRIRMTYYSKVAREHNKFDLLEDHEELGKQTPFWVYDTMAVMPYLACCVVILTSIFIVLMYGVKFQTWQENLWMRGSLLGLCVVVTILEMFRIMMLTLVELRKYENRKKSKSGVFLPRRVPSELDKGRQIAPPPRLYKRATAKPAVPKGNRPNQLPKLPPRGPPPSAGPGLGVAPPRPPPPPKFSAAAVNMAFSNASPGVPPISGGMPSGVMGRSPANSSRLGATGGMTPPGSGRGGARSPTPSNHSASLQTLNQSLNQQVKKGADRHPTPPPPPGQSRSPSHASGGTPPPPPADGRPGFSRPPSRPVSATSGVSSAARRAKAGAKASMPPMPA